MARDPYQLPPQGVGDSTASMPCRAITLYLFLGLAREAQGHGASRGPEPLAVQRLYFNVYLLQRETAFGFEPLMRKKNILWSSRTWWSVSHWGVGGRSGSHMTCLVNRLYNRYGHKMPKWWLARLRLSLIIIQQHIGDSSADGEKTTRFRALQGALQHINLRRGGGQS